MIEFLCAVVIADCFHKNVVELFMNCLDIAFPERIKQTLNQEVMVSINIVLTSLLGMMSDVAVLSILERAFVKYPEE